MSESYWHGWRFNAEGHAVHVGPIPTRKGVALYVMRGGVSTVLTYFKTPEQAREALGILDALVLLQPPEEERT